ncbi:MAG TPA: sigma-70 family RNA polymerase sigma factor [Opitutaceae bacterium]|nr:sigma-70 family RNA polymerase sigma factor [Opitutaceae bacterium]HRE07522.1 sigma-70 family RNA polymerase sigma factor [Opitutaceae bacterium]
MSTNIKRVPSGRSSAGTWDWSTARPAAASVPASISPRTSASGSSPTSRRAPGLFHHPALGAWLHRCTRNLSLEILRKKHRVEKLAQSVTSISNPSTPPEPSIEWERVRPLLDEAIDRLPESDHEIVLLRYFGGLSFAEAG